MDRLLLVLREFRDNMHEANGKGCTEVAESGDSDYACCPDMDYASLRPAPFYECGYTEKEINLGNAPDFIRKHIWFE